MAISTGYQIVLRAFTDIFSNFPATLRISLPWCFPLAFLGLLNDLNVFHRLGTTGVGKTLSFVIFIALIGFCAISIPALAISWHRFILRNQATDRPFKVDWSWPLMSYLFTTIAIGLFTLLAAVPLYILARVSIFFAPHFIAGLVTSGTIWLMIYFAIVGLVYITLRLGVILPAIALEDRGVNFEASHHQHTFKWSWQTTKPHAWSILVVAAGLTALGGVFEIVNNTLAGDHVGLGSGVMSYAGYALVVAANWLWFILNISILTTLYGFVCLNRPLRPDERAVGARATG